jgi:hypothetical protein
VDIQLYTFLTSVLYGDEWQASRPGRFTPQGKSPYYPLDRRLCGHQSRSGRGGEEKNSQPLPWLEPLVIQPVTQRYSTEPYRLLLHWGSSDFSQFLQKRFISRTFQLNTDTRFGASMAVKIQLEVFCVVIQKTITWVNTDNPPIIRCYIKRCSWQEVWWELSSGFEF